MLPVTTTTAERRFGSTSGRAAWCWWLVLPYEGLCCRGGAVAEDAICPEAAVRRCWSAVSPRLLSAEGGAGRQPLPGSLCWVLLRRCISGGATAGSGIASSPPPATCCAPAPPAAGLCGCAAQPSTSTGGTSAPDGCMCIVYSCVCVRVQARGAVRSTTCKRARTHARTSRQPPAPLWRPMRPPPAATDCKDCGQGPRSGRVACRVRAGARGWLTAAQHASLPPSLLVTHCVGPRGTARQACA